MDQVVVFWLYLCIFFDLALDTTTLIISNEEMKDVMKIVKSLEESRLLKKGISATNKDETEEQKNGYLSMALGKSEN